MDKVAEAVVVGGGIIGASTAYYLAKKGVRVVLVESGDIAAGTSSSCDMQIMLQSKKPGILLSMALAGAEMFNDLPDELGADLQYHRDGGMVLIEDREDMEFMESMVLRQQEGGVPVRIIGVEDARELQPAIAPEILGSTYWEGDAHVNPIRVCLAMARAARSLGAKLVLRTRVNGLISEGGRITGVRTDRGDILADSVVVAAGVWTPGILRDAGLSIPIIPRKGQLLVTEKMPPAILGNVINASYIACKHNPDRSGTGGPGRSEVGFNIGQTAGGNLLIGGTREFVGFDRRTEPVVIRAIVKNTLRLFPGLKNISIIRTFAGLRPHTPDGLPLLGAVPQRPGLFLAAGHGGDGIAMGPFTGRLMADIVTGAGHGWDLSSYNPERFAIYDPETGPAIYDEPVCLEVTN